MDMCCHKVAIVTFWYNVSLEVNIQADVYAKSMTHSNVKWYYDCKFCTLDENCKIWVKVAFAGTRLFHVDTYKVLTVISLSSRKIMYKL